MPRSFELVGGRIFERSFDVAEKRPDAARVAHLSDLHIGKSRDVDPLQIFERWIDRLRDLDDLDACVVTGDLAEIPDDRATLVYVRDALDGLGVPSLVIPGNHDIGEPGAPSPFLDLFGDYPRVEVIGGICFILFDSFSRLPRSERPTREQADADAIALTNGRIGAEQFADVGELPDLPRIAVVHHHPLDLPDGPGPDYMLPLLDLPAFMTWAAANDVTALLHGHMHPYDVPRMLGDLLVLRGGSTTKPGMPVRLLDISPDAVRMHELEL